MLKISKRLIMKRLLIDLFLLIVFFIVIIMYFFPRQIIKSISSSYYNSCYTTYGGKLYVMGMNSDGKLGNFNGNYSDEPQKIEVPNKVKVAVVSLNSIAYIDQINDVYMLGIYGEKQNDYLRSNKPVKIEKIENIKDIKAGEMHFLALDYDGNVWIWGENECNQVSLEKNVDSWIPQKINNLNNIEKIECGFYNSCAYTENHAYIWGEDSIGLTEYNIYEDIYTLEIENIEYITIGRNHMVIKTKDNILGYGSNAFGQMGKLEDFLYGDTLELENVESISCGIAATVFTIKGKVYYLGDINPFDDIPEQSESNLCDMNIDDISQIDCNAFHLIVANKKNIELYGNDSFSQSNKNIDFVEDEDEDDYDFVIALIDTGVDTENEMISNSLEKSENKESKKGIFHRISKWNLCAGNEQLVDDVFTDSHGTSMLDLIMDIKWKLKTELKFCIKGKRNGEKLASKKTTAKVLNEAKKVALKAPKLRFNEETTEITVKGKIGSKVYIRERNGTKKSKWVYYGVILNKSGITKKIVEFDTSKAYSTSEYYEVRLKDLNGKYSKKSKLKLTTYVSAGMVTDIQQ